MGRVGMGSRRQNDMNVYRSVYRVPTVVKMGVGAPLRVEQMRQPVARKHCVDQNPLPPKIALQ